MYSHHVYAPSSPDNSKSQLYVIRALVVNMLQGSTVADRQIDQLVYVQLPERTPSGWFDLFNPPVVAHILVYSQHACKHIGPGTKGSATDRAITNVRIYSVIVLNHRQGPWSAARKVVSYTARQPSSYIVPAVEARHWTPSLATPRVPLSVLEPPYSRDPSAEHQLQV